MQLPVIVTYLARILESLMKRLLLVFLTVSLLPMFGACSASTTQLATQSKAIPAEPGKTGAVDFSCSVDADCTVKNVGNCCGAAPACVNVASRTDPQAVMAQCQASGRMSVCGSRQISGCQCLSGKCAAKSVQIDTLRAPVNTNEPVR